MKKALFSGIQPSGILHIGNYWGAIKQWIKLQKDHEAFFCVVDLHAITVPQEPAELRENTLNTARMFLATGIDPKRSTIFVQSHVPAHAELAWILNTITPLGELERMTQFKDKKEQQSEVYAGLFNYPALMAADILLYQTDVVPVGEDQRQHIELARSLARRFNNRFGKTFKIPKGLIPKESARIMGLDDPAKKMSKSATNPDNYIALLDPVDVIRHKIKTAVTDSGKEVVYDEKNKPAISNLIRIYAALSGLSHSAIETRYSGKGYAEFKKDLAGLLMEKLGAIQHAYHRLTERRIKEVLRNGAQHANKVAAKTLAAARTKVGLLTPSRD